MIALDTAARRAAFLAANPNANEIPTHTPAARLVVSRRSVEAAHERIAGMMELARELSARRDNLNSEARAARGEFAGRLAAYLARIPSLPLP